MHTMAIVYFVQHLYNQKNVLYSGFTQTLHRPILSHDTHPVPKIVPCEYFNSNPPQEHCEILWENSGAISLSLSLSLSQRAKSSFFPFSPPLSVSFLMAFIGQHWH